MNSRISFKPLAVLAMTTALTSFAGVKYWDNPGFRAYDVGDYVQDGLVVNYDGIRNAGPNADHDSNATTWVNCANPDKYNMTRYSTNGTVGASSSATAAAWTNDASKGAWTDYGFTFSKNAVFRESEPFTLPTKHTIQTLVDANSVDQSGIGYIFCGYNATGWQTSSIGIRSNGYNNNTNLYYFVCENGTGGRPTIPATANGAVGAQEHFYYATAILDVTNGVMFAGTTAPWTASGWKNGHVISTTKTPSATTINNGVCIGGHYPRTDELFKGTIKSVRFYNRCLSDTEVAYNRMVDEARYFGRKLRAPIPVTNIVVSTSILGDVDDHFALDAEGYTFTAPAQRIVEGKRYTLSGYKLKTWNNGSWGEEESHTGVYSYTASDSGMVCITWQYDEADGEGRIKTYGIDDYVQGGLLIFLDGIRNAGANAAHDYSATKWANLGSKASSDATLSLGKDASAWTEDGFNFFGKSSFSVPFGLDKAANSTMQILSDVVPSQQQIPSASHQYIMSGSFNQFALSTYGNNFCFRSFGTDPKESVGANNQVGYKNMIVTNGDTKASIVFTGTTIPSSGNGYQSFGSLTSSTINTLALGGWGGDKKQFTIGGVKFFRYYNRVLTEDELAHNRRVDNYRYFGIYEPETTNVIVQSTYSYLEGNEASGPYEVETSYTFTAPESVTAPNGITYVPDGYMVETWNGTEWTGATKGTGNAYRYQESDGTVRLTWRWKATQGLRSATDYTIDDLAAGAALHYDGIRNAGVGAAHSKIVTKWVNLGTAGSRMDLSRNKGGTGSVDGDYGEWNDYGYEFTGSYRYSTTSVFHWPASYTVQTLVDVPYTSNTHADGNYVYSTTWNQSAFQLRGSPKTFWFLTQTFAYDNRPRFTNIGDSFTYGTAILDGPAKTAVVFPGTTVPTNGTVSTGYKAYSGDTASYDNSLSIGGWGGASGQNLRGTVKFFRYYDRVLTEEELVRNRNVDSARYFGELAVTNVFVVAGGEGSVQTEADAYKVEGSWTFTASKTVDRNGSVVDVVRYSVEELVDGEWKNKKYSNGNSYTYTEGTDPVTVRLKWLGLPAGTTVIVR